MQLKYLHEARTCYFFQLEMIDLTIDIHLLAKNILQSFIYLKKESFAALKKHDTTTVGKDKIINLVDLYQF